MLTECPRCHATQPYRLSRPTFDKPFACCTCGYVFTGLVYEPATKSLLLEASQEERLAEITNLARYADEVLKRWTRLFGQNFHGDKWSLVQVALSTVVSAEGP